VAAIAKPNARKDRGSVVIMAMAAMTIADLRKDMAVTIIANINVALANQATSMVDPIMIMMMVHVANAIAEGKVVEWVIRKAAEVISDQKLMPFDYVCFC